MGLMKFLLRLDWHEDECVILGCPRDGTSEEDLTEVPDDLIARRNAAWIELEECESELRKLYDKDKGDREGARLIAERKALEIDRKQTKDLKDSFYKKIRAAKGEKGVLDLGDIEALLHGLDYGTKERNLMQSLISNTKKVERNFVEFGATPEAIAKREERQQKRDRLKKELEG